MAAAAARRSRCRSQGSPPEPHHGHTAAARARAHTHALTLTRARARAPLPRPPTAARQPSADGCPGLGSAACLRPQVYAAAVHSEVTGADTHDALVVTCSNGALLQASGVGTCPDGGFKVVSNWIFGSEGMLYFGGLAGSDGVAGASPGDGSPQARQAAAVAAAQAQGARLQLWRHDGAHRAGAPFAFESFDPNSAGPGSLDAFVRACRGESYQVGAGPVEGLKVVATLDALYRSVQSRQPELVVGCEGL